MIKEFITKNPLIIIGGIVAAYVIIRTPSQVMKDITNALGKAGSATVQGASEAAGTTAGAVFAAPMIIATAAKKELVATANNPSLNPLYDLGSWIGGAAFDLTHPSASPVAKAVATATNGKVLSTSAGVVR